MTPKAFFPVVVVGFFFLTTFSPMCYAQNQQAIDARNLGYQIQQQGNKQEAIAKYQQAISIDPTYAAPHNDLGILYEEIGQLNDAEREYKIALQKDPQYAGVYSNLAALYETRGDYVHALDCWTRRAEMGAPNDEWTRKAKTRADQLQKQLAMTPDTAARNTKNKARKHAADDVAPTMNKREMKEREQAIEAEIVKAQQDVTLYKKEKMIEVENAWYPPTPEPDAGTPKGNVETLSTKSAARIVLEKKAQQVIPAIDFTDAQLKDVVEYLALSNDINIVIDEQVVTDVSGVTVHLKNIPLVEALDIILRTKGLKYRFEDNIIWITTAEKLAEEELVVRVYDVQDLIGKLHDFPGKPFDIEQELDKDTEENATE